jgi:hypothetical protein
LAFFILSEHGFSQRMSEDLVDQSYVFPLRRLQTNRNELKFKQVRSRVTRRSFFVSHSVVHVLVSNLPVNTAQGFATFQVSALEVQQNCALLGYYLANSGNSLRTFSEPLGYVETSVRNYHYSLRTNPKKSSSQHKIVLCLLMCYK